MMQKCCVYNFTSGMKKYKHELHGETHNASVKFFNSPDDRGSKTDAVVGVNRWVFLFTYMLKIVIIFLWIVLIIQDYNIDLSEEL